LLLQDYFDRFNVPKCKRGVPAVFTSDSYLVGSGIAVELQNFINASRHVVSNQTEVVNNTEGASEFDGFSLLGITVAALVDSVNPCSMAILFFLMAGLLIFRKREKALKVGLAFTLSVFVANLLFGLGILTAIGITSFSSMFKVVAGAVAIVTGGLLIKDCFWHGGGGFTMEVPSFLRPYLKRRLIRAFFGKNSSILAAFAIGFLVSSFEVPCTGGPYFYVLAGMADEALRLQTLPVLFYYNLVFVLPLLVITALLYFGSVHVERVRGWQEKNKPLINLGRGLPMMAVGFLTIPMQWTIQALTLALHVYRILFIPVAVILISYMVSRSEYRGKMLKGVKVGMLAATVVLATTYAHTGTQNIGTLSLGSLVVTVQYVDGTPVEGAGVRVYKHFNVPPELNVSSGFTNATGQFKAASLPYCNYTYWVETLMSDSVISYVPVRVDDSCTASVVVNPLKGDINGDGVVNILDLINVGSAFGSYPGHPKWNPLADLKKDNKINVLDLSTVGINYGKEALTGCVNVKVQFYNGDPIEGAEVKVINSTHTISIGFTDSSGIVQNCSFIAPGEYTVKVYYGGNQYGKDANLTVNSCGVGNALIDGKGCMTFLAGSPVSGLDTVYYPDTAIECPPYWSIGSTNSKGVAQNCNGLVAPGDYIGELWTTSCWGGYSGFRVYSDYSGFVKILNNGNCFCIL
jgi:cytochrome c biogenesis protein CcdA